MIHSCVSLFEQWSRRNNDRKAPILQPRVVTSNVEHPATERPLKKLEAEGRISTLSKIRARNG